MTADPALKSATDLATMIRRCELSSVELLHGYVARWDRLNRSVNAIVTLDLDRAERTVRVARGSDAPSG